MRLIVFAVGVLVGLSAAVAQDSAMPLDLSKYIGVLRGFSEQTQKSVDLVQPYGGNHAPNLAAAVRDVAAVDQELARSRYVRDISLGLLAELVSFEKTVVSCREELAKAPDLFGASKPVGDHGGRPVRRPTPHPGIKERSAIMSTFHRKKADVAKNVASRLLLLEKHAETPVGRSFSLPADVPFLAAMGYQSLPPAPRVAMYRTMEFEIAEILPKGLLVYIKLPDSSQKSSSGESVTERRNAVFLRNYDIPVTPGDSIRVQAGEAGTMKTNGITRPQYIVLKQQKMGSAGNP